MRCDQAMGVMARLDSAGAAGVEAGLDEAALAHVLGCGACMARLDQLSRAVSSGLEAEIACAECRERLPEIRELLAGAAGREGGSVGLGAQEWLATLAHVRRCPYCAEELVTLDAVMSAWVAGALPVLAEEPVLDLSFLERAVPGLWLADAGRAARAIGEGVRTLFTDIVVAFGAGGSKFGRMPGPLAPVPLPAGAMRDATATPSGETIEVSDPEADLTIRLAVGPLVDRRAVIDLLLHRETGRAPLADTRVVLYDGDERLLASAVTAADGRAQLRDLGSGRYLLEIRRPGQRWRLPLRVIEEDEAGAD